MNNPLFLLLFFGIFTLIGGGLLGQVIRRARRGQFASGMLGTAIGGLAFSLMPLCMAWGTFAEIGAGYLFLVQVFVLLAAFLVAAFLPDEYLASLTATPVAGATFGGFFFIVGLFILGSAFKERSGDSLLMGLVFSAMGLGIAVATIVSFLRNKDAAS